MEFLAPLLYRKFIFIPLVFDQGKVFALMSLWTGLLLIGTTIGELLTRDDRINKRDKYKRDKYIKSTSLISGAVFIVSLVLFLTYLSKLRLY